MTERWERSEMTRKALTGDRQQNLAYGEIAETHASNGRRAGRAANFRAKFTLLPSENLRLDPSRYTSFQQTRYSGLEIISVRLIVISM